MRRRLGLLRRTFTPLAWTVFGGALAALTAFLAILDRTPS